MLNRSATADMLRTLTLQARDALDAVDAEVNDFEEDFDTQLFDAEEKLERVGKLAAACVAICEASL